MSKEIDFKELSKPLNISDVEFRVSRIWEKDNKWWAILLAYKNARVDMNRLDEVCWIWNWQRDHKEVKGVVYWWIGIKVDEEWIWKWDAWVESFSEAQKWESSDSFKRAGFNWGIGRELYDYPFIYISLNEDEWYKKWDKIYASPKFLKNWTWGSEFDKDWLLKLAAKDEKSKLRFNYKRNA